MTSKFDKKQAIAFLKVIDPGATRFSFQTFDDSPGKHPDRVRLLHGTLDELWAGLCRLSLYGAGVFVTINETDLSGRKARNIVRVRALFADLDGAPLTNLGTSLSPLAGSLAPARGGIMCSGGFQISRLRNLRRFKKRSPPGQAVTAQSMTSRESCAFLAFRTRRPRHTSSKARQSRAP